MKEENNLQKGIAPPPLFGFDIHVLIICVQTTRLAKKVDNIGAFLVLSTLVHGQYISILECRIVSWISAESPILDASHLTYTVSSWIALTWSPEMNTAFKTKYMKSKYVCIFIMIILMFLNYNIRKCIIT